MSRLLAVLRNDGKSILYLWSRMTYVLTQHITKVISYFWRWLYKTEKLVFVRSQKRTVSKPLISTFNEVSFFSLAHTHKTYNFFFFFFLFWDATGYTKMRQNLNRFVEIFRNKFVVDEGYYIVRSRDILSSHIWHRIDIT